MIEEKEDRDVDVFGDANQSDSAEADPGWVKLPAATLLTVEDADSLLQWRPANLVAIIGEQKGGKTTLAVEIYERFLRGPFAKQFFSYSQTLLGFEQKSYQSRADSLAATPDTPRTSVNDGLLFFHLSLVAQEDGATRTDLLISERAGEIYRQLRDKPEGSKRLEELLKAQTVVFIVDGERVAIDRNRAEAFASVRNMIRAFSDAGAIPAKAEVQLVTTKYDLLMGVEADGARNALDEFEKRLVASYGTRFARFTIWHTSARDPKGQVEPAWGVAELLESWLKPPNVSPRKSADLPKLDSEFDRLLIRRGPIQ